MNVNATGAVSAKRPGLGAGDIVVSPLDVEGALQVDLRVQRVEENVVALNHRVLRRRNVRGRRRTARWQPRYRLEDWRECCCPGISVLLEVRTSMSFSGNPDRSLPKR